jgi:hypothetical protein
MLGLKMNVKHYRWVIVPLIVVWWAIFDSQPGPLTIGMTQEFEDGKYRIAGGSAPWALACSVVLVSVYILLMLAPVAESRQGFSGWWRRFTAFWLDFLFGIAAVAPVIGLVPILIEWKRTGVFAWTFERVTPAAGDDLVSAITFVLMVPAILFYFACPIVRSRPSPGACVMGYQIVGDGGVKIIWLTALKRTLLGFTFLGDRKRAVPRIDSWFGTHVVRLK